MGARERGFTLLEMTIAVGIFAILLATGAWALASHPNALAAATDDLDASLAQARAIAASSGNGATLVFAVRHDGTGRAVPGFALRVYRGRPNTANVVSATSAMPLFADAAIRERTLGTPPFAIFIDSAGNASAQAQYPSFDAAGEASFPVIAQEPACPAGGFTLTLTNPQDSATTTRTLACRTSLSGTPAPNPSPTPNRPVVTPGTLLFHWPGDRQQQIFATEWGYTHWFASTSAFSCGSGIAAFPDVLPSPYSDAYSASEALLPPPPPANTPYSYPNSNGGSMNDAPASFPLQPQSAGLCSAAVQDDHGQSASSAIVVMGWLTASYASSNATHAAGSITIPASALPQAGSSVTLTLAKTFDTSALAPRVAFTGSNASACTADLAVAVLNGTTPGTPSNAPATAFITLTVTTLPPSALSCAGVIYNHYFDVNAPSDAVSEAGEGVAFTASLSPATGPLAVWPAGVVYPVSGQSLDAGCSAVAYKNASLTQIDANDPTYASLGARTDANGCYSGVVVASETGYRGAFTAVNVSCGTSLIFGIWTPANSGPIASLQMSGGPAALTGCAVPFASADQTIANGGARTVAVAVDSCSSSGGTITTGSGCEFTMPESWGDPPDCAPGGAWGTMVNVSVTENPDPMLGTITQVGDNGVTGTYVWTRTAPGTQTISWIAVETTCRHDSASHGTITFN
ncbi:MAG TPA: prepilin-type N-terminal cleavage/methylation domain-containing protein [Candidatus Tyrphobacter sp.]